jgi:hypothetical protein
LLYLIWFAPPFLSILTCFSFFCFFSRLWCDVKYRIQKKREENQRSVRRKYPVQMDIPHTEKENRCSAVATTKK